MVRSACLWDLPNMVLEGQGLEVAHLEELESSYDLLWRAGGAASRGVKHTE